MAQEVRPGNQSLDCYTRIPFPFMDRTPYLCPQCISLLDLYISSDPASTLPSALGLFLAQQERSGGQTMEKAIIVLMSNYNFYQTKTLTSGTQICFLVCADPGAHP